MARSFILLVLIVASAPAQAATTQKHYYAHDAVEDDRGVIAPWYTGQNGQVDWRVRIAAETLKRYPWTPEGKAPRRLPEYMWSGAWKIDKDGTITVPPIENWMDGDMGQRAAYVLAGWVDYYRYSGDPAAIAHMSLMADMLLDFALTPDDHPWPRFLISVPTQGKPYGQADPHGFIQLDIVAEVGIPLIKAAQICGNARWMEAARHWGDLLAQKRERTPGVPPWGRYANATDVPWTDDHMAGGVAFLLEFFDTLFSSGYTGKDNAIVEARKAGVAYLRDVLLPKWTVNDTWGRNYWDWNDSVQAENVTEFVARYLLDHPEDFPNGRNDARNVLTLFLNHTGVAPGSGGDVYSGAWAFPESNGCCGRSLWYGPMELAPVYAQFGAVTGDPLMREIGQRMMILATYDAHETGVVEDNIDGGQIVAGAWFKIAHPMALKHCLNMIAWQPEVFAPPRENHIVRSTATVANVRYEDDRIIYRVASAPLHTMEWLRLSYRPASIKTGSVQTLSEQDISRGVGYEVRKLQGGDYLVTVRHDDYHVIIIEGKDPQQKGKLLMTTTADASRLSLPMIASTLLSSETPRGNLLELEPVGCISQWASGQAGSTLRYSFTGRSVRVLGRVFPKGGIADVILDDVKQFPPIDCWCPDERVQQTLFYRNGLEAKKHEIKIVVRGERNPVSQGASVVVQDVLFADEASVQAVRSAFPAYEAQRWIFGYPERTDYVDKDGHAWQPATQWTVRGAQSGGDSVATNWWTTRTRHDIEGTTDPELYRYGAHGHEFWADFTMIGSMPNVVGGHAEAGNTSTAGPDHADANSRPNATRENTYHARLKFMESRNIDPKLRAVDIFINGQEVVHAFDIASTAVKAEVQSGGPHRANRKSAGIGRAVDLVFNNIRPSHGVISIKFRGSPGGEAIVQAIEVGPGEGGQGDAPVSVPTTSTAPAK